MACEGSYCFISGWVEHPFLKAEAAAYVHDGIHGLLFFAQARHRHSMRRITRKPRYGMLIVDNADRHVAASKAAYDCKALIIAAHDHRAHWLFPAAHGCLSDRPGSRRVKDHERFSRIGHDIVFPAIARISAFEEYRAPDTNCINGPKLQAAGAPSMCKP